MCQGRAGKDEKKECMEQRKHNVGITLWVWTKAGYEEGWGSGMRGDWLGGRCGRDHGSD